jgi:hypothetical protein
MDVLFTSHHLRHLTGRVLLLPLLVALAGCDSPTDPHTLQVQAATIEAIGDALQLEATVQGTDRLPEWESLNPEIVAVTRAGMAVAVAPGTARVRARVGSQVAEGNVTVLPPVDVQLLSLALSADPEGRPRVQMRLRNAGGRGYYKYEYWRMRETEGGEHRRVLSFTNDFDALVGMDISGGSTGFEAPDWVIVYSREPHSTQYRRTGCMRVDGGVPCPVP